MKQSKYLKVYGQIGRPPLGWRPTCIPILKKSRGQYILKFD